MIYAMMHEMTYTMLRNDAYSGSSVRRLVRRGFTLIEVMTAITLTAIVLGIAAAALGAATSARNTVQAHQRSLESESRLQSMVTDMLQHAPPADAVNEPMLQVERDGANRTTLVFLSTGVREPFGTGPIWRVVISHDGTRLTLDATPINRGDPSPRLHTVLDGGDSINVRMLEPDRAGESPAWRDDWPVLRARPALVELSIERSIAARSAASGVPTSSGSRGLLTPWAIALDPLETNR